MMTLEQPLVYIILLNYKGYEYTTACIQSLHKLDYLNYKVVVVDNASNDGSYELLKNENPDCDLILANENRGFASGNNIGIQYALKKEAEYIMLLNNDTVVTPMFLKTMLKYSDKNTITTPSIYYYDDPHSIWYANAKINYNKCVAVNGTDEVSGYVDYASGCCFIIHRELVEKVGFLSEEYFMYYEDMDYSIRVCRSDARIYYVHNAVIYHKAGSTAGIKSKLHLYYDNRNRFYIIKKFKFGMIAMIYSYVTRFIRYLQGVLMHTNETIARKAFIDFKKNVTGKAHEL